MVFYFERENETFRQVLINNLITNYNSFTLLDLQEIIPLII